MADLYHRLKAIRERQGGSPPSAKRESPAAPPCPPPVPDAGAGLGGWSPTAAWVHSRELRLELPKPFADLVAASLGEPGVQDLRFIDTETTGLSGGAGTWVFLAGHSRLLDLGGGRAGLAVRQYFLEDLGGEPDFLAALEAEWAGSGGLVSYNGASFDLPLLRTRWIMNGRLFPALPHRDCLTPARRLFRAVLGGASLGLVEAGALGIRRRDDLPGALVPQAYLGYLRAGAGPGFAASLERVFAHHAQDMVSLACLYLLLCAIDRNPRDPRWLPLWPRAGAGDPVCAAAPAWGPESGGLLVPALDLPLALNAAGLARLLPEPELAAWALECQGRWPDPEWLRLAARAAKRQARLAGGTESSQAHWEEARGLWLRLWEEEADPWALVEYLKYLEHRGGRAGREVALGLIDGLAPELRDGPVGPVGAGGGLAAELARRSERLRRRLDRDAPQK